ncbi:MULTISPECIES: MarR family winged helix-turn-helix transcriptional regulator [unclassified Bacillus (in: firmicutes)]|uniref:MarR family winged helix-turn-helix transcriptional regulator n=1 Tax=unclassified Bacillus (in: firmicutes) TaxID=185979 RepID=UPI000B86CEE0|nr:MULTISPECIES: MarR family transcriptional regulator [unclassified Bacillus (in: firmicutes)]
MQDKHQLFHTIHQLSRKLTKHLNEALEPFGLYSAQWSVLYVLKEKGTLTQKELCDYLAVEAPPMTRTIQRLSKLGYIQLQTGEDKRKKFIGLSEKALEDFPKWEETVLRLNQKLVENLPESAQKDLRQLISSWIKHI